MYRNTQCLMQAHKGVSTEAPENTMPAYRLAVEQGYDLIEADPKFTKDNICVMLHDKTLNRTARLNGQELTEEVAVADLTYGQLADYDVGIWKGDAYCGVKIPRLRELLTLGKETGIAIKIDNVMERFTPEQQEILLEEVRSYGGDVGITGAHLDFLARVARALPEATIHYDGPVDEDSLNALDEIAAGHKLFIWARYDNKKTAWNKNRPVDEELAAMIKRHGKLGVWILSMEEEMARALALGADVVETNGEIKP